MNTDIILELVDTAVALAQDQFSGSELTRTLRDIIQRGVDAYDEHTGETLDPFNIKEEEAI